VRSIESRLQRAEKAVTPNDQTVFAKIEQRGEEIGIILPDTGEWMSMAEAKVSPKCKNMIAWNQEHEEVLWRSKLSLADIAALASIKEGE